MWRFIRFLNRWLYCYYKAGTLVVRENGEYRVPTGFTPSQVWTELDESELPSVCQASPDGFDVQTIPGGFVLVAKINGDRRKINWFAIR